MSIALLAIMGIGFILLALFIFPVVGLAMIPLAAVAVLAILGGLFVSINRGAENLPESPPPGERGTR